MAHPTDASGARAPMTAVRICGLALAAATLLSSCAKSDSGGGDAGGASTPTTYLFFTGGASAALGAVDPANATPAGLITVEPIASATSNVNVIYGGSYDGAALRITGVHHHAVAYFKDVGGAQQLFKASALTGAAPAPVRVSSASFANSGATTLCIALTFTDYANPDNSRIVYTQAGADASCGGTDNPLSMATLSMSATTAPVSGPTGASVIRELRDNSGTITGWIMLLGANLRGYQADMASFQPLGTITSVSYLASGTGREFLAVDGSVKIFDGTATLKNPGNAATALTVSFDCKADDTYLFCADTTAAGRTIRRLPLDGSASWTAIYTGFSETMTGIVLSENRVLYKDTSNAGLLDVSGVLKLPANPASNSPSLVCRFSTTNANDERIITSGPRVYCSETSDSPTRVKHVREDGEDEVAITDSSGLAGATLYWTWQGGSSRGVNDFQAADRLLLMGTANTSVTRVTSYDGSSGFALADLTNTSLSGLAVPQPLGDSNNGNTLLVLLDSSTAISELFFANNATANSLLRLTTTPGSSEVFVGASGCTLGSGQTPDPLLPLLVVVALAYLWRRRTKKLP
jgi:hypothetical protein